MDQRVLASVQPRLGLPATHMKTTLVGLCTLLLLATGMTKAAETPETQKASDDDLRIRGVFNSALPRTEKKHALRFIVHPHMGDLTRRDEIRTALGFRYGVTTHWEATVETDAYFSHGLKAKSFFQDSGFSTIYLGTKYQLGKFLGNSWDTAIGLDWQKPIGSPPPDVTDGLRHIRPFISTSHQLASAPAWRIFGGFGFDDVKLITTRRALEKNELGDNTVDFSGGALYERGSLTYALETTYFTTRITGTGNHDVFAIRPSILWVLPEKITHSPSGKWILGLGLRLTHGPDGNDIGVNAKLRLNFDFKRLLGWKKKTDPVP